MNTGKNEVCKGGAGGVRTQVLLRSVHAAYSEEHGFSSV